MGFLVSSPDMKVWKDTFGGVFMRWPFILGVAVDMADWLGDTVLVHESWHCGNNAAPVIIVGAIS